jgi:hypothetical protein
MLETLEKNGHMDDPERRKPEKRDAMARKILDDGYRYEYPALYMSHFKERAVFNQIIQVVAEKSEAYKDDEEGVRRLLYEAFFTGRMLDLGREIEKTLGKGTLRLIAEDLLSKDLEERLGGKAKNEAVDISER